MKIRTFAPLCRGAAMLAILALAGMSGGAGAQMGAAPTLLDHAPDQRFTLPVNPAGLWDQPSRACIKRCGIHKKNGCFSRLSEKSPDTDAADIYEKCEAKFSLCIYDCMCENCSNDQIIIRPR